MVNYVKCSLFTWDCEEIIRDSSSKVRQTSIIRGKNLLRLIYLLKVSNIFDDIIIGNSLQGQKISYIVML